MKNHDKHIAILVLLVVIGILFIGYLREIPRDEIEPTACSLNEITLGQMYEVMGKEYYLTDISRWAEGNLIELQFRAELNE